MNISRIIALAVALCIGVGLALAVLWLTGLQDGYLVGVGWQPPRRGARHHRPRGLGTFERSRGRKTSD